MYIIENNTTDFIRGWRGHKIEQRWFSAISGKLDMLYIPPGYISSIQSLEPNSKLLVFADNLLGKIKDEFRFDMDYIK